MSTRRRRKGFTFNATDRYGRRQTNIRVRVYGGLADARKLLADNKYTDCEYIPDTVQRAEKVAGGGWSLDAQAFRALLDREGIEWPVLFVYNGRATVVQGANGNHQIEDEGRDYRHRIMVKSYLTPEQAEKTVRHEVRHARQDEQLYVGTGDTNFKAARSRAIKNGVTYSRKPREVDARQAERENADLTLTRKSAPQTGQRRFAAR